MDINSEQASLIATNMELNMVRRGKQCSYCDRSFARSEHLSRHERSHRNERPFRCTLCTATFSRQDTYKRHQSRYHSEHMPSTPRQQGQEGSGTDPTVCPQSTGVTPETAQDGLEPTPTVQAPVFDPADHLLVDSHPIMGSSTPAMSVPQTSMSGAYSVLTEETPASLTPDLTPSCFAPPSEAATATACPPQRTDPFAWKGSFDISEQRHRQLVFESEMVAPTEGLSDFRLPTRFALERLLNTFAECLLIYIPCIHTPTWKAEEAHPSMIFAMASIGANYLDDDPTSASLHRIARALLKKYIWFSPHTIADEPLWVLQCCLLIMINGSRSASFQIYQEASSMASLLVEGIRYRKCLPHLPIVAEGEQPLLQQWQQWIDSETITRTVCATYVYLSALEVNYQNSNGLCNVDMRDCFLPSDEAEWMSPTPQAWLGNRQSGLKTPIRFMIALANLSSPQGAPLLRISTFGSYVALHGIVKQLASLYQDVWLLAETPTLVQRFEQALDRWRLCAEQHPEFHASPRYPNGAIAINALSLYRQAYVRLCANFGPFRATVATRNVQTILQSMKSIDIVITRSSTCLKAARCAIEALQTSVKMGLFLSSSISGWHRKLLFNLYSIECCVFLSFWIREQSHRSASVRSAEENQIVKSTQETLTEIDLDPNIAVRPHSIQLIYAWALVFQLCNASGLHGIIAEVLRRYADSLTE